MNPDPASDHFSLFGLEPRFDLDRATLEKAYRLVQSRVHPDRYANAGASEQRVAMEWAVRANEAFRVLKAPLQRAAYLCERHGVPVDRDSTARLPVAFLAQQMQWREVLEDARASGDRAALHALAAETAAARAAALADLTRVLDVEPDYDAAAQLVRKLMFIEKFDQEVAADADAVADAAGTDAPADGVPPPGATPRAAH